MRDLEKELAILIAKGETSEKEILKTIGEVLKISKTLFELEERFSELEKELDFIQILSDERDCFNDGGIERIGHCNAFLNPAILIERREMYENLSEEAKTIISLVLHSCHDDFRKGRFGCLFWKQRTPNSECRIVKKLLREAIHQHIGWTYKVVDIVFMELREYCRELDRTC